MHVLKDQQRHPTHQGQCPWFQNFTNYRARILFHCGKLDLGWALRKITVKLTKSQKLKKFFSQSKAVLQACIGLSAPC